MGTREIQKGVRRKAILEAARDLIREAKGDDFSMPDLAERAGVSLVTPYNLFGSKSSILLEIAKQDIFERTAEIDGLQVDSLYRWVEQVAELLAGVFHRNRHFYRRMIVTLTAQESAEAQREVMTLGIGMFVAAAERLQRESLLAATLPPSVIARHLSNAVSGILQGRLMERGSEAVLRRDLEVALSLSVAGLCHEKDRQALLDRAAVLVSS